MDGRFVYGRGVGSWLPVDVVLVWVWFRLHTVNMIAIVYIHPHQRPEIQYTRSFIVKPYSTISTEDIVYKPSIIHQK